MCQRFEMIAKYAQWQVHTGQTRNCIIDRKCRLSNCRQSNDYVVVLSGLLFLITDIGRKQVDRLHQFLLLIRIATLHGHSERFQLDSVVKQRHNTLYSLVYWMLLKYRAEKKLAFFVQVSPFPLILHLSTHNVSSKPVQHIVQKSEATIFCTKIERAH